MTEPDLSAYPPPEPGPELRRDAEWQRLDPRMLLVHPIREVIRFLPVLIVIAVARTAAGGEPWQLLGVAVPDRARPAALPDHQLPDQPGPDRARSGGCSTGTCSRRRWTGCGPSTSPPRRSTGCSGSPRCGSAPAPPRPATRTGSTSTGCRWTGPARCASELLQQPRPRDDEVAADGAGARRGRLRPGVGAVRAADRQRAWSSAAAALGAASQLLQAARLLRAVQPRRRSTSRHLALVVLVPAAGARGPAC